MIQFLRTIQCQSLVWNSKWTTNWPLCVTRVLKFWDLLEFFNLRPLWVFRRCLDTRRHYNISKRWRTLSIMRLRSWSSKQTIQRQVDWPRRSPDWLKSNTKFGWAEKRIKRGGKNNKKKLNDVHLFTRNKIAVLSYMYIAVILKTYRETLFSWFYLTFCYNK